MIPASVERLIYLVAAGIFITGLKQLQNPATARHGNRLSAIGMLIAIVVTVHVAAALYHHFVRKDRVLMRMLTG